MVGNLTAIIDDKMMKFWIMVFWNLEDFLTNSKFKKLKWKVMKLRIKFWNLVY